MRNDFVMVEVETGALVAGQQDFQKETDCEDAH